MKKGTAGKPIEVKKEVAAKETSSQILWIWQQRCFFLKERQSVCIQKLAVAVVTVMSDFIYF